MKERLKIATVRYALMHCNALHCGSLPEIRNEWAKGTTKIYCLYKLTIKVVVMNAIRQFGKTLMAK